MDRQSTTPGSEPGAARANEEQHSNNTSNSSHSQKSIKKPKSINSGVTGVTCVTPTNDGACEHNTDILEGVTGVTSTESIWIN